MGAISSALKSAVDALDKSMREIGKSINSSEIEDIVKTHCAIGAASAVTSAALPGAGAVIATGVAISSLIAMYVRLSSSLGIKAEKGLFRAIASAIVADVGEYVAGSLGLSFAL